MSQSVETRLTVIVQWSRVKSQFRSWLNRQIVKSSNCEITWLAKPQIITRFRYTYPFNPLDPWLKNTDLTDLTDFRVCF